jgi:hypothetical protein
MTELIDVTITDQSLDHPAEPEKRAQHVSSD